MRKTFLLFAFLFCFAQSSSTTTTPDVSFILETTSFTPYTPTYIGNGSFSLVSTPLGIRPAEAYKVWVYDHGTNDVPRIAVLPAWNEIDFHNGAKWFSSVAMDDHSISPYRQRLDMLTGLLQTDYQWTDGDKAARFSIEAFVSRSTPDLAAMKLELTPQFSGPVKLSFSIRAWPPPSRMELEKIEKIEPDAPVWYPGHMLVRDSGSTGTQVGMSSSSEGRGTSIGEVCEVKFPANLKNMSISNHKDENTVSIELGFDAVENTTYTFFKFIGIASSQEETNPMEAAKRTTASASAQGYDSILKTHTEAWHRLWQTDILVEEPELQKVIHSMIFYILCSVREGTEFSIPPMGLSSAGYYGHIFWDADTWMFPPLLVMHPEFAKSMAMFRYRTLEAAKHKARKLGFEGAMYPWEADELGKETTPKFANQNALYEIHVTGAVALAQWQYYLATGDKEWLAHYGYPVIQETADFWVDRAEYNLRKNRYEIRDTVSVDEGLIGIHNDTYTNAIAKKNLEIATAAAHVLQKKENPAWRKISSRLFIPYDEKREYHPTYENAPAETIGSVVPLLRYPLELSMSEQAKRNDLTNAFRRIREKGSGGMMGITVYPIVAAETGNREILDELLPTSYKPYLRPPFHVLAETPTNDATNFLTGAGGFLQQVIFGYTGLRLSEDGLTEKFKPLLPSAIKRVTLKNFHVRNKTYDIVVEQDTLKKVAR